MIMKVRIQRSKEPNSNQHSELCKGLELKVKVNVSALLYHVYVWWLYKYLDRRDVNESMERVRKKNVMLLLEVALLVGKMNRDGAVVTQSTLGMA